MIDVKDMPVDLARELGVLERLLALSDNIRMMKDTGDVAAARKSIERCLKIQAGRLQIAFDAIEDAR